MNNYEKKILSLKFDKRNLMLTLLPIASFSEEFLKQFCDKLLYHEGYSIDPLVFLKWFVATPFDTEEYPELTFNELMQIILTSYYFKEYRQLSGLPNSEINNVSKWEKVNSAWQQLVETTKKQEKAWHEIVEASKELIHMPEEMRKQSDYDDAEKKILATKLVVCSETDFEFEKGIIPFTVEFFPNGKEIDTAISVSKKDFFDRLDCARDWGYYKS